MGEVEQLEEKVEDEAEDEVEDEAVGLPEWIGRLREVVGVVGEKKAEGEVGEVEVAGEVEVVGGLCPWICQINFKNLNYIF